LNEAELQECHQQLKKFQAEALLAANQIGWHLTGEGKQRVAAPILNMVQRLTFAINWTTEGTYLVESSRIGTNTEAFIHMKTHAGGTAWVVSTIRSNKAQDT
jgi:hypothetical protein